MYSSSVYPTSEVGGVGERRYPASEVRGSDKKRYPTPLSPRPGAEGGRSYPTSKEPWLCRHRRA